MKNVFIASVCGALLLGGCSSSAEEKLGHVSHPVQETSDKTFKKDVALATEPVLVDFYATWCPPCRKMSPIVDQVAEQFDGKIKVFKVDVDKNPLLSQALGIESIPTLVVFKNGQPATASTGAIPKSELVALVQEALSGTLVGHNNKNAL